MAKINWDSDDAANVLAFLSWMQPIDGAEPNSAERDCVECGRQLILDACRQAITGEEPLQQPTEEVDHAAH